jgi:hemoglobin-like flavoprotein
MASKLGEVFYKRLFESHPESRPLFTTDMRVQSETLMSMLGVAVNMLDRLSSIEPIVEDLGRRHLKYKVRPEHVKPFREALLYTLRYALGKGFDAQVREAWEALFDVLVHKMGLAAPGAQQPQA